MEKKKKESSHQKKKKEGNMLFNFLVLFTLE